MSKWNGWIFTTQGKALEAQVAAGQLKLELKSILLGDGAPTDIENETELANRRETLPITSVEIISDSICCVEASFSNAYLTEDLAVSELGVTALDADGNEILYVADWDNDPDTIPAAGSSAAYEQTFRIYLTIADTSQVTVNIDSSTFVTIHALEAGDVIPAKALQDGNGNVIADTYLPLSGGTMTGPIHVDTLNAIRATYDDLALQMFGGGFKTIGVFCAGFWAHGIADSLYPGWFRVRAGLGSSNFCDLVGKPDGTLEWGGKLVDRIVSSGFYSNGGYVKHASGLLIQYGYVGITASNTPQTISLPCAFSNTSYKVLLNHTYQTTSLPSTAASLSSSQNFAYCVGGRTASSFQVIATLSWGIDWIAVGC